MRQNIKLELPPGVARRGTEYAVQGRYYDADLVRWYQGSILPIGGWRPISETGGGLLLESGDGLLLESGDALLLDVVEIAGASRAIVTWLDKSNQIWAGIGTHSGLYVMTQSGVLHNVTPGGFTPGREDAEYGGGYGSADYSDSTYGTARANISVLNAASMWTLDVFDEYLIGCMPEDGTIYEWALNTATPAAAVSNAPSAQAVLMTNDLFVMALGADSDPRKVRWSDRGDRTDWTAGTASLAGDTRLQTNGKLRCGKRFRGGELLFTNVDVHLARYVGKPEIYIFERLASGCGIVSPQAAAVVGSQCFWMTENNFWLFNGYAQPLPCDVQDYVFGRINGAQASKVYAVHNSLFGEVWWFYPSGDSLECDSYVAFNYLEGHWNIGELARTCGTNQDVFGRPLFVNASGQVYEHEIGQERDDRQGRARSAPIELGNGDRFMETREYIPDEATEGDTTLKLYTRMYPNDTETEYGPFTSSFPKFVRASGRQLAWEWLFPNGQTGRVGVPRLKIRPRGRR